MLYIHYCETYFQNVSKQVDVTVNKKLQEYSLRSNFKGINAIASYAGGIYVLNLTNPHYKIFLEERRIEINDVVLVVYFVRDAISMGQNFNWIQNYYLLRDGKWLEYNPIDEDEIIKFTKEYSKNSSTKKTKAFPPAELTQWHDDYKLNVEYDVYETEQWVNFAISNSRTDGMRDDETKLYGLALDQATSISESSPQVVVLREVGNVSINKIELNNIGIIYSQIYINSIQEPIYLLYCGANFRTQVEFWQQCISKAKNLETQFSTIESIQRLAVRAYPKWALKIPDLWSAIQKNKETGNLSLLPEQTNFLKKFTFPKYINGQAGSGKSTMLYYLFSNAYYYKCAGQIKGEIIFLTENEDLLKHTKKSIIELLQCNPEFELSTDDISNIDKLFTSFKRFLLSLLPDDSAEFPPNKYLDFSKFKILYENSNIAKHIKSKYSSELVWFAISTYILGYDPDLQITSQNYDQDMPKEGKELLGKDELKGIERDVLPFYRKLIDVENYWDKLKIIKYIKTNVSITNFYEIIFCDEAQDFSRVELRFILNSSEYLQYNLSNTKQVPVVFAGDALQTVNPTGFRSAEVKDMLYDELKSIAGFNLNTNDIEYAPSFNYRSSQPIVNVANAIQYYRKKEYKIDVKKPQIAKRPDAEKDAHLNIFLDYETLNQSNELKQKLKYKTIIIPKNSDEKEDFYLRFPVLKEFGNVKSAVEAKGIDYDQVVLFGFGEHANQVSKQDEYQHRFFYNKLYVAVTRAQYELVIIDSKETEDDFWRPLIDNYAVSEWAQEGNVAPENIKETIVFGANQIPNVIQSTPEMAKINAFKDKEQGIFDKNPNLLRVAANQFLRLGEKNEHFICLALMKELQGKFNEAAEYYLKKEVGATGVTKAADTYWNGKLLEQFKNLNIIQPNETHLLRLIIINLFANNKLLDSEVEILKNGRIKLRDILSATVWKPDILTSFVHYFEELADEEQLKNLIVIFEEIASKQDKKIWNIVGQKSFSLKRYEYAIDAFEKIGETGFYYVKSNIELSKRKKDHSNTVRWLNELIAYTNEEEKKNEIELEIIENYRENKAVIYEKAVSLTFLSIYSALIITNPKDELLFEIARKTESLLSNNRKELAEFYSVLLNEKRVKLLLINFVIIRWAKNRYLQGIDLQKLNNEFKVIAFNNNIKFEIFSAAELDDFPETPTEIYPALPKHFRSICINNFRGLKDSKIDNAGLYNLIVGDNNIGKTTLLEALLFSPDKREYLTRLAFSYIERRNIQPDKDETSEGIRFYYKLDKLFLNDFKGWEKDYLSVEFIIENKRYAWRYLVQSEDRLHENKNSFQVITFSEDDYKTLLNIPFLDSIKQPLMPYGKGFGIDLAQVYLAEIATKPRMEDLFLSNMKVFIPRIRRVIVDTKIGTVEILDEEFPDTFLPLHQYGEGANKLFRLLLLLALNKGGRVLIDEIDAGIHFSRFKQFWKIILEVAKRDNIQIVATTHNDECIEYFVDVLNEIGKDFQSESRVIQLKKVNENIKIRCYQFDSFNLALEDNIELRGGRIQ